MADPFGTYQAIALKAALKLYARTGIKANTAYTPKRMMQTAQEITGKKFKAWDYLSAADALQAWIDAQREQK